MIIKQARRLKQQLPDTIILLRLGDFYESFDEDAKTVARVCGVYLTSKQFNGEVIHLAGVPFHSVQGYIDRLMAAGYKVAKCDQMEAIR